MFVSHFLCPLITSRKRNTTALFARDVLLRVKLRRPTAGQQTHLSTACIALPANWQTGARFTCVALRRLPLWAVPFTFFFFSFFYFYLIVKLVPTAIATA